MKELKEKFYKTYQCADRIDQDNVWRFITDNFFPKEEVTEAIKPVIDYHRKEERNNIIKVIEGLMEAYRADEPNPSVIGAYLLLINKIESILLKHITR